MIYVGQKIIFGLIVFVILVVSKSFAMTHQLDKYQHMFSEKVESPLSRNNFGYLLNLVSFVNAKEALRVLDGDQQNESYFKAALSAVNKVKAFITTQMEDLNLSVQYSDIVMEIFQEICSGLDNIAQILTEKLDGVLPQQGSCLKSSQEFSPAGFSFWD